MSYEDRRRIIATLAKCAREHGYWEEVKWGERIEDRGSLVTFSALGQEAPQEAKYAWDPTNEKKQRLRAYVARCLPDLEVRVNGLTSVDVTLKGVDKAYGMRKLMNYLSLDPGQIIFVGDRLYEGGNDYPVKATGIRCLAVSSWTDTARFVEDYLTGLDNCQRRAY